MTSIYTFLTQNSDYFQNAKMKRFSQSPYSLKSEILDCMAVALEKKRQFRKDVFEILKILERPF